MAKITLFIPDMRGGGAQRVTLELAEQFTRLGYQVDLLLLHLDGPFLKKVPDKVQVVALWGPRLLPTSAGQALSAFLGLRRYLRENNTDYLVSALTGANIVSALAKRLFKDAPPTFLVVHNTLKNVNSLLYRISIKYLYRYANSVITVSQGIASDIRKLAGLPGNQVITINNPHDTASILAQAGMDPQHRWLSEDADIPVLVGMGTLTRQKDFITLIEAMHRVRGTRRVRLLILGAGPEQPRLQARVDELALTDDVEFTGYVQNPFAFLNRAAVFVLSSKWEGLPNVLVEALIIGTPIVSTNCHSGPDEILEGGKYGLLVDVGDVDAMAAAILRQIDSPIAAAPQEEVIKRYRPEGIASQYLNVFKQAGNT